MKYCVKCGYKMQNSDQFCPKCGTQSRDIPAADSRSLTETRASDLENARMIKEYLNRAREMEWTYYSLQEIGNSLKSKLSGAQGKRSQAKDEINRLNAGIETAEDSRKNYKREKYSRKQFGERPDLSWEGYGWTIFLTCIFYLFIAFMGYKRGFPGFGFLIQIYEKMCHSFGLVITLLIVFVVVPSVIYIAFCLIVFFVKKNKFDQKQNKKEADYNQEQATIEKERISGYQDTVRKNRGRIAELKEEIKLIDDITIPQLNEEIRENEAAAAKVLGALNRYYEPNVVYKKYRGLVPIAAFTEYFDAERCYTLTGPDGAYNIYENEMRMNLINAKLDNVQAGLNLLAKQHSAILTSLNQMNANVRCLVASVDDANEKNRAAFRQIENGTRAIGYSTQLSNYYQSSMNNSLRHLDYMQSVDYYSKHLF